MGVEDELGFLSLVRCWVVSYGSGVVRAGSGSASSDGQIIYYSSVSGGV